MAKYVVASAERTIDAPADDVYRYLADMHLHARFLPPPFYDFQLEEGGIGAGSVVSFKIKSARGVRKLRMEIAEPEPGRILVQADTGSSGLVRTFTVTPHGEQALVNITSRFDGETGIAGFVEGLVAPLRLHRVYVEELTRLNAYAREQRNAS
ncbi:SRPBCC family protein [Bradyrhizobium sp. CCGUVB23]|uniref:SRPBCC family protein n=1 Tax=Bradyrhizobium sp. CCGUVB23 TaxID=2949630 RepID=UPI0020B2AC5B|nr:SRPBCC family protein [Bradyrhizobium sp. CCGUVB23]MCP3463251.1 SRPBCC family protein [Bradyrhizobium sp. CCGUVB23]